jgi:hypothetical protein
MRSQLDAAAQCTGYFLSRAVFEVMAHSLRAAVANTIPTDIGMVAIHFSVSKVVVIAPTLCRTSNAESQRRVCRFHQLSRDRQRRPQ